MFKGKISEILAEASAKKVDSFQAGKDLDERLDKVIGEKSSERIQRGAVTHELLDLLKGLWHESHDKLGDFLISEGNKMKVKV